jgi:hypothetical protein
MNKIMDFIMTRRLNFVMFFLVYTASAIADDYSFSGYGSTGYIFYDRSIIKGNKEESFYAAKLQMAIELTKKIETQLDFRAESSEHAVELREFSVKFEYYDYLKFKFGNVKLPFGAEQLESRENLVTFDRSIGHENYSELGFGGRSIGFLAYYNYSEKRKDFPYSYYFNLYRNNNLTSGAVLRGAYHYSDFVFGGSYMMQYRGGGDAISSSAAEADITFDTKQAMISVEGTIFKDPVASMQNIFFNDELALQTGPHEYRDEEIYGATLRLTAAYKFSTDADVIKDIEPVYMFSTYYPDINALGNISMQNLLGANFYFSKQVRLRVQADFRLTKTEFSNEYTKLGTRGILDLQIRF